MAAPAATTAPYAPSRAGVDSAANRVSTPSSSCSNANGLSRPPCTNQSQRARSVGPSLIDTSSRVARASPSSPIHQGFHRRASTRRTSGSLAPALARTRATSGRPHRRAAVSDVNPRVVMLLRIVARRVVGVGVGVGVGVRIIIIAPACLVRSRAACESNANSNSTSAERPFDEHRWTKKTRASVLSFDARDDVVTTSSSRHRARSFHSIPFHAMPFFTRTDRSIDGRASASFLYVLCVRERCVRRRRVCFTFPLRCVVGCFRHGIRRTHATIAIASTRVVRRESHES